VLRTPLPRRRYDSLRRSYRHRSDTSTTLTGLLLAGLLSARSSRSARPSSRPTPSYGASPADACLRPSSPVAIATFATTRSPELPVVPQDYLSLRGGMAAHGFSALSSGGEQYTPPWGTVCTASAPSLPPSPTRPSGARLQRPPPLRLRVFLVHLFFACVCLGATPPKHHGSLGIVVCSMQLHELRGSCSLGILELARPRVVELVSIEVYYCSSSDI